MHDQCIDCIDWKKSKPKRLTAAKACIFCSYRGTSEYSVCFRSWYLLLATKKNNSGYCRNKQLCTYLHRICLLQIKKKNISNHYETCRSKVKTKHFWPCNVTRCPNFDHGKSDRSRTKKCNFLDRKMNISGGEEPSNTKTLSGSFEKAASICLFKQFRHFYQISWELRWFSGIPCKPYWQGLISFLFCYRSRNKKSPPRSWQRDIHGDKRADVIVIWT